MRSRGTRIPRPAVLAGIVWTALAVPAAAQTVVQVTGETGQDATWTADNTYVLNGFVFVDDGATLTIEPGTVVRGKPGQGENASALIVAQGGRIFAEGTPREPHHLHRRSRRRPPIPSTCPSTPAACGAASSFSARP